MKKLFFLLLFLAAAGAGGYYGWQWYAEQQSEQILYSAEDVSKGEITVTINSTGVVEPEELINVGAQVSGRILSFGVDANQKEVDYCSEVNEGSVLANIDSSLYEAELLQSEAQVLQAKASIERAHADSAQYYAKLKLKKNDHDRAARLVKQDVIGQAEYETALAEYETCLANVRVGEAEISQANAALASAEAGLRRARQNMEYCQIISPVKGVVIDRRVNIGQTVVSSMSASSIFLIAKDLSKMQVWVSVNEADVGKIKSGQKVIFSIDAFPGREFQGFVGKIRLNAALSSNVVIYTVEVQTDNKDGTLLPYLTANVKFIIDSCKDEVIVSNAALRFVPSPEEIAEEYRKYTEIADQDDGKKGVVWMVHEDESGMQDIRPVEVEILMTDDINTAVRGELKPGDKIALGTIALAEMKSSSGGNNPFMPKFGPRRRTASKPAAAPAKK